MADASYTVVLIVGDYTADRRPLRALVGRPVLADEGTDANAQRFAEQAFRVLDRAKTGGASAANGSRS